MVTSLRFFPKKFTRYFYVAFSFIEMYLRPPSASEEARINDWIKVRQAGIRYYLSLGDQRIVDKNFIIRPKAEFEVRNDFPNSGEQIFQTVFLPPFNTCN